ncbi:MAG: tandem-95 repeat protein, partial [Aeromicrobium sp.]|nr:tandem-95 repeat protein [Aeromicrobium sp.]
MTRMHSLTRSRFPRMLGAVLAVALLGSLIAPLTPAAEARIGVQALATIEGTVTDSATGLPLVGAYVQAYYEDDGFATDGDFTDENGEYVLEVGAAGSYRVEAEFDRYTRGSQTLSHPGTGMVEQDFALVAQVKAFYGVVREAGSLTPIEGGFVQAVLGLKTFLGNTNALGEYEIWVDAADVPNNYQLTAGAPGYAIASGGIVYFNGVTPVERNFELTPLGVLYGYVTDVVTEDPLSGALVSIQRGNDLPIQVSTDADGYYERALDTGTYTVRVASYGYTPEQRSVSHNTASSTRADFALTPKGPVAAGTVVDAISGTPLSGAQVDLEYPYFDGVDWEWRVSDSTVTGADGVYELIDFEGPADDDTRRIVTSLTDYVTDRHEFELTGTLYEYTVELVSTSANNPPVANADSYEATLGVELVVPAPGVLGNDTDADGHSLSAELVSPPASGTLDLREDGSFTFMPAVWPPGDVTFTYRAFDGYVYSDPVTVTITVTEASQPNTPPVANDDAYTATYRAYNTPALSVAAPGVLANDTDADSDPLTAVKLSDPAHGSLTLNTNGSFTYTPDEGFLGTDTFTYRASDGTAHSPAATVTITVALPG